MLARIVWGRIAPGKWNEYEATYKKALSARGTVDGLTLQWLCRDEADENAGFDISLWESQAKLTAYIGSRQRKQVADALQPFFVNQYTVTHCDVRHMMRLFPKPQPGDLDVYHTN